MVDLKCQHLKHTNTTMATRVVRSPEIRWIPNQFWQPTGWAILCGTPPMPIWILPITSKTNVGRTADIITTRCLTWIKMALTGDKNLSQFPDTDCASHIHVYFWEVSRFIPGRSPSALRKPTSVKGSAKLSWQSLDSLIGGQRPRPRTAVLECKFASWGEIW